eukprot:89526-Amorphochlora_amoeboformis.AAC.3
MCFKKDKTDKLNPSCPNATFIMVPFPLYPFPFSASIVSSCSLEAFRPAQTQLSNPILTNLDLEYNSKTPCESALASRSHGDGAVVRRINARGGGQLFVPGVRKEDLHGENACDQAESRKAPTTTGGHRWMPKFSEAKKS